MELKDRWIIMLFLVLLILTLVVAQTKRESLKDGAAGANLRSLSDAHNGGYPHYKRAHSFAAKTAVFSCRDKFFTLFDLLENILDPGLSNENSQDFAEVMGKDLWKPGEATN